MEKIQAINELYNSVYAALKANSDLRKYVTNIYDYLPKQVTIPYLRLRAVNYNNLHMLSNFATKARFSCDIYTYHIDSMFAIIRHINLILKSIEGFNNEAILESIALFTIIRTDRNMLLACYSHKHISYRIRTIIRKAIIVLWISTMKFYIQQLILIF
ncbi:MAG: hypothetical protein ACRC6C_04925 [Wolbachia pipientis]